VFEVEIKAHLDDPDLIETRLIQLGAILQKTIHQSDNYFQHPIRNFAQTDEAIRIRMSENNAYLTYKGPKIDSSSKTREEIEVEMQEPDKLEAILKKIGFSSVARVIKSRKCYFLEDIKISLDKIEGLKFFIELELEVSNEAAISNARNRLVSLIKQLGIPSEKLERRSYLELLLFGK
jgi:adenylate cyclase class 2